MTWQPIAEVEELRRKSSVDDIAFASANHLAVQAEMRAEAAEARVTALEAEKAP